MAAVIRIRALVDGFRRAGRAWSTRAEQFPAGTFPAEILDMLRAEPLILVEEDELVEDHVGETKNTGAAPIPAPDVAARTESSGQGDTQQAAHHEDAAAKIGDAAASDITKTTRKPRGKG